MKIYSFYERDKDEMFHINEFVAVWPCEHEHAPTIQELRTRESAIKEGRFDLLSSSSRAVSC